VNALLIIVAFLGVDPDQPSPAPSPQNKVEAEQASANAKERVAGYSLRLAMSPDDQGDRQLKQEPEPVLRWTNHLNRRFYGDIYLWTYEGRPAVVASLTSIFTTSLATSTEIHSLSTGRPILSRNEAVIWEPAKPGVEFRPLPGAPKPGATAAARLRQMRDLAVQFSVAADYSIEKEEKETLRLLTTPIFRYQSAAQGVADGAMFAFTKGTDPDAFLLVEARGEQDAPQWHFAFARFSGRCILRATHKDVEVWHVDQLPWSTVTDPKQPYFNFR
jgi:hypothetical protein